MKSSKVLDPIFCACLRPRPLESGGGDLVFWVVGVDGGGPVGILLCVDCIESESAVYLDGIYFDSGFDRGADKLMRDG
ncbi:MAG: hypothetical protein IPL83_05940 [Bdellovibrionales bacterium]|nr:hypothetical protein [Bdellovibrionales bacterium]